MPRILIGDLGGITRLGLRELLCDGGFDVVAELGAGEGIVERVAEMRPDVVILDLEAESLALAARIAESFPATKVIACSSDRPVMRIFPRFHHGESYLAALNWRRLADTVSGAE